MGAQVTHRNRAPSWHPLAAVARAWYDELVVAQEVVVPDLKQPEQRARLEDCLADADVLIMAMRPSALSRLDLHRLAETYPVLIHVEIVGHEGEAAEVPGHDLTCQAAHGTLCPPTMPLVPVADLLGAERAVSAAVAGLLSRTRTGMGGHYRIVLDQAAQMAGAAVRHGLMGPSTPLPLGGVTYVPHISHFGRLCRARRSRVTLRGPGSRAYWRYDRGARVHLCHMDDYLLGSDRSRARHSYGRSQGPHLWSNK
ncbi:MAG: CoA transferase [Pseudomonadota bacterium]|nr:CoA transferase [Pseudomonadota bacterium]